MENQKDLFLKRAQELYKSLVHDVHNPMGGETHEKQYVEKFSELSDLLFKKDLDFTDEDFVEVNEEYGTNLSESIYHMQMEAMNFKTHQLK